MSPLFSPNGARGGPDVEIVRRLNRPSLLGNLQAVTSSRLPHLALASMLLVSMLVSMLLVPAPSLADERSELTRLGVRTEQLAQLTARFLGEARRDARDAQVQCLDRKLAEVHALLRQAWYRSDNGLAPTEALQTRYAILRREVHACVGIVLSDPRARIRRETRVEVHVERDVPNDDPTALPRLEGPSTIVPPG